MGTYCMHVLLRRNVYMLYFFLFYRCLHSFMCLGFTQWSSDWHDKNGFKQEVSFPKLKLRRYHLG